MTTVELIYDRDCPNVLKARAQLLRAFAEAGRAPQWVEWDRGDPASPGYVRGYGSPTILVDGKDVAGTEPSDGIASCRVYADAAAGFQGVPPVESIVSALKGRGGQSVSGKRPQRVAGWWGSLAALPAIMAALLPVGICPACWPIYAAVLGAVGAGFLLHATYLLPLTILFLLIAVGSLGFRARRRRGYGPFAAGVLASVLIVLGKFGLNSNPVLYGGAALLVAASLWNGWPGRTKGQDSCPACVSTGTVSREVGNTENQVEDGEEVMT